MKLCATQCDIAVKRLTDSLFVSRLVQYLHSLHPKASAWWTTSGSFVGEKFGLLSVSLQRTPTKSEEQELIRLLQGRSKSATSVQNCRISLETEPLDQTVWVLTPSGCRSNTTKAAATVQRPDPMNACILMMLYVSEMIVYFLQAKVDAISQHCDLHFEFDEAAQSLDQHDRMAQHLLNFHTDTEAPPEQKSPWQELERDDKLAEVKFDMNETTCLTIH
jgi:hypothetical protein